MTETRLICLAPHPEGARIARFRDRICGTYLGPIPFLALPTNRVLSRFEDVEKGGRKVCLGKRCPKAGCGMITEYEVLARGEQAAFVTTEASPDLSQLHIEILTYLQRAVAGLDSGRLAAAIGGKANPRRIRRELQQLAERGFVRKHGETRGARWVVVGSIWSSGAPDSQILTEQATATV
jgi:hypothetical protein